MAEPTPHSKPQSKLVSLQAKQPPHSIEAEQSVLGGLMLNNKVYFELADKLRDADFYRADHQLIYRGIGELIGANKPCDFVTLSEHLRHQGRLDDAGGVAYLGSLAVDTYSIANLVSYAEIVRERAVLRGLIAAGADIGDLGYRPEGRPPAELVDQAEQMVFAIRERGARGKSTYEPINQLLQRVEARIDLLRKDPSALAGLSTGFSELDRKTNGLHPGDLVIVAARPSMGKCLSRDAELVLEDGSLATIEQVYQNRKDRITTLRSDLKFDRAEPGGYLDDGLKPVFEVTTRLGRRVETTAPHPFLTLDGWKSLAELQAGDHVAVPRQMPVFGKQRMRECEIKLLGYLIGDGGLTSSCPSFTNTNPVIQKEFAQAVSEFGGLSLTPKPKTWRAPSWAVVADRSAIASARGDFARRASGAIMASGRSARAIAADLNVSPASLTYWTQGRSVPNQETFLHLCRVLKVEAEDLAPSGHSAARHNQPNALVSWLQTLELAGKGAGDKHVPRPVFTLPRDQMALFLNRLFATDGWATVLSSGQAQLGYSSISERLARQVQHLLLRFGVIAKLRLRWIRYREARRPSWQLDITDAGSIRSFANDIGIFGKEAALERVLRTLSGRRAHTNTDLIPAKVWNLLEEAKGALSWSELARRAGVADSNIHPHSRGLSRQRLARFAMALNSPRLMTLAHSEVYWDRIESIIPLGNKQVYDLTIPQTHNFVANDICVHNTSFAMNIAEHVAIDRKIPVAVFSMEMSGEQLALRVLSSFGRIELSRLGSGRLDDDDMNRLVSADALIREAPLYIDETGALSPLELRARARRLAAQHDIKLIVVDYLQLMQVSGTKENRTNEISEISRNLKALAKELSVPVIALSQLNRALESRDEKRPRLADLRESGGIEQDADLVLFIYRDEVYYPDKVESKGKAEIIIGKQRSGPLGKIEVTFLGQYTKFDNLADSSFAQ